MTMCANGSKSGGRGGSFEVRGPMARLGGERTFPYSSPLSLFVTPDLIRGSAALDEAPHSAGKRAPDQVRGDGKLPYATGTTRRRQSPSLLTTPLPPRHRHTSPTATHHNPPSP